MAVVDEPYISASFKAQQQKFIDLLRERKLHNKVRSELESVTPVDYVPSPMYEAQMRTCSVVTGGIYDAKGRNVTTDPDGKPIEDKPRRIATVYEAKLGRFDDGKGGSTERWQLMRSTQEKAPC